MRNASVPLIDFGVHSACAKDQGVLPSTQWTPLPTSALFPARGWLLAFVNRGRCSVVNWDLEPCDPTLLRCTEKGTLTQIETVQPFETGCLTRNSV